jgi:hypothetical protein
MMEYTNGYIETAFSILSSEIREKGLNDVEISLFEDNWLKIELLREDRTLWLGYKEGLGYFVSWEKAESGNYFDLNRDAVSSILALLPSNSTEGSTDEDSAGQARELFESINESEPDPEKIKQIIEEAPSTEEGIDVLATVASIKAFRIAIERLRSLIETQAESKHSEQEYQNLLAANPWMLGSHYTEVLVKEYKIWFGARVDLMLMSALGHVDIVELKRPDTPILKEGTRTKTWRVSVELADAQGQARKYLKILDEHRIDIEANLPMTKQSVSRIYRSTIIIVAGRTPKSNEALEALRDVNASDRRILTLTYDDVLAIAEATIKIFERKLQRNSRLLG